MDLKKINEGLKMVDIKGKNYVMVKDRVKAFRENYDGWALLTEMVDKTEEEVTFKATVYDPEGTAKATGYAHEEKRASAINRTSMLENGETSAMGRALANLGIGIDDSYASANEVENAQHRENANKTITKTKAKDLRDLLKMKGYTEDDVLRQYGVGTLEELTGAQYADAVMRCGGN